ncbi:hypothetical protein SD71_08950 [Cohnella kolymensis]|uniref:Ribosome hibernation promoting factor n=1 Tax=Cohnella kolymensis TaxID=1590652 RepID=A0ABR5A666_9BACL|nr:ribosome-associated translation inhibitor RaiA [Cohnella kolymensis]KIL36108.1 hypothetical protein SD71_08950 [Cohnella kolymensis]
MRILVHGKNLEVTEPMKEYAERKLERLHNIDDGEILVTFSLLGHRPLHKVEVTLRVEGTVIRAEEAADDMYAAIDLVTDKLTGKFRKFRDKIRRGMKRGFASAMASPLQADEPADEEKLDVARIKTVDLKPVDLEEAILQMNLLDHAFHVFINTETGRTEVVYRRRNGTYGLIRDVM